MEFKREVIQIPQAGSTPEKTKLLTQVPKF
jgi:hypothetical protein